VAAALRETPAIFEAETFRAHVTIGRARRQATPDQSRKMHQAVQLAATQPWGSPADSPFECREIVLVRSDLKPTGPVYTPLHRSPLRGN